MQRDARATGFIRMHTGLMAAIGWLALGIACTLGLAGSAAAQSDSAYTVRDIQVTKTGATGLAAQDAAVRAARDQALAYLFRRLTPPSYHNALPVLPAAQVDAMVVSTDIQQEQITATAYTGTMALRFSPAAVRQQLQSRNIPFTDRVSPLLIVVPVYERAGALQLWEVPNAWDSAWRARVGAQGLVQTVMAGGNPSEQLVVSADQALAGDAARLQALAQAYGARGAIVAYARFMIDPRSGQPALETRLTGYGAAPAGPFTQTFTSNNGLAGGPDKAAEELSAAAVSGLSDMLAEAWKKQNLQTVNAGAGDILAASRLTHLGEYANLIRQLREIPAVEQFSLAKLSAGEAVFRLRLSGSAAQAQSVFSQYGMSLTQTPDGWNLRSGG